MRIPKATRHTLGEALQEAQDDAWGWWYAQHGGGLSKELAWSERVLKIQVTYDLLKQGRVRASVRVIARRPWETESYNFGLTSDTDGSLIFDYKI